MTTKAQRAAHIARFPEVAKVIAENYLDDAFPLESRVRLLADFKAFKAGQFGKVIDNDKSGIYVEFEGYEQERKNQAEWLKQFTPPNLPAYQSMWEAVIPPESLEVVG